MRKTILTLASLAICLLSFSQDKAVKEKKPATLSFTAGPSIPIGSFGESDPLNVSSGMAKMGTSFAATYTHFIQKDFGIAVSFLVNWYETDTLLFSQGRASKPGDNWQMVGFSVGPAFSRSFSKKLEGDFRLTGGFMNVNTPVLTYALRTVKKDTKFTPVLQAEAGLNYSIGKKIYLLLNAAYMHMDPKFDAVLTINGNAADPYQQSISVINVRAGLGVRL